MSEMIGRRGFIGGAVGVAGIGGHVLAGETSAGQEADRGSREDPVTYKGESARFGLVTCQWGKDWDLPTLLRNCEASGLAGVELRTTHKHGVETTLSGAERDEIRKQFSDSSVTCIGPGSDERFDHPDREQLEKAIERTKEFIRLSHDIGGSGVKVKPNDFHPTVPQEETIGQIGRSLGLLADYATGFGQEVRLEVHGKCAALPVIAQIIEIADHPSAKVCWNCNRQDLEGGGIETNFSLVKDDLGETLHVRELDRVDYPYARLMDLLVGIDYAGWILIEASSKPDDRVLAMKRQRELFDEMLLAARRRAS